MPKHRHFLVVSVLLVISQHCGSKKPDNKPPIRILPGRLRLNLDFYQECENISTLAVRITNAHARTTKNNMVVIDADFNITRVIPTITQTVISILNCPDRASGQCQLFQTWRFGKESCRLANMQNQVWSPILESIHPRLRCPVPQGQAELRNGTLDTRILETLPFPFEQYYWRIRTELFDPSLVHCTIIGAQMFLSRT